MLDDFKPVYPNEERLWQLFLRVHDSAPAVPSRSAVHVRVQIAYAILQEYEREVALLKEKDKEPKAQAVLIKDLKLPGRVESMLREGNITTVDQLCEQTDWDLLRIPSLGRKALNIIKEALQEHERELHKLDLS